MILSCHNYSKVLEFIQKSNRLDSVCFDSLFISFPEVAMDEPEHILDIFDPLYIPTPEGQYVSTAVAEEIDGATGNMIDKKTLASILHNYIKKRTMITSRKLKNDIEDIVKIYNDMVKERKSGIFICLAEKYRVTPVSIARQVVEYFESKKKDVKKNKLTPKELVWDSTLINNGALAYEVHIASLFDSSYSQIANIVATLSGKEYEMYLQTCLCSQGLSFKTENELRNMNFSKTPDILLDVPFATENFIIKWIESKACFGDDSLHEDYLHQQYQHYYRFGPGLVIYWYGFMETVKNVSRKLLISEHFPTNIVKMG